MGREPNHTQGSKANTKLMLMLTRVVREAVTEALDTDMGMVINADAERNKQARTERDVERATGHEGRRKKETEKSEDDDRSIAQGPTRKEKSAEISQIDNEPKTAKKSIEVGEPEGDLSADKITYKVISDRLNIIRSGRSLDDSAVESEMEEYVGELDDAQRIALFGFLKSIGQIVAGDADGGAVKEPDEDPYAVRMSRVKDLEKRRKQGDLPRQRSRTGRTDSIKAPPEPKQNPTRSKENTRAPIQVGESISRNEKLKLIHSMQG